MTDTEKPAKKQGLAGGLTEGHLRTRREDVLDALEIRFGEIPYQLREAISTVSSDGKLKKLHRLAITVESLERFKV